MKKKKRTSRRAFTLAELLIVTVIIAILASLVVPRFTGQAQKAATAEAIGIMSAVHRALLQYHDEHDAYPALDSVDSITQALAISYQTPQHGWSFTTDANGNVNAARTNGNLTLDANGTWGGTGDYAPSDGKYWPYLNQ